MFSISFVQDVSEIKQSMFITSACNCFQPGSYQWNTCEAFGGQCQCKQGYGGRRCDQCIPGYYGNPTSGCIRKCS